MQLVGGESRQKHREIW